MDNITLLIENIIDDSLHYNREFNANEAALYSQFAIDVLDRVKDQGISTYSFSDEYKSIANKTPKPKKREQAFAVSFPCLYEMEYGDHSGVAIIHAYYNLPSKLLKKRMDEFEDAYKVLRQTYKNDQKMIKIIDYVRRKSAGDYDVTAGIIEAIQHADNAEDLINDLSANLKELDQYINDPKYRYSYTHGLGKYLTGYLDVRYFFEFIPNGSRNKSILEKFTSKSVRKFDKVLSKVKADS